MLTDDVHDRVKNSPVGQYLDRLIREAVMRGGPIHYASGGNIIQQLYTAFTGQSPYGRKDS